MFYRLEKQNITAILKLFADHSLNVEFFSRKSEYLWYDPLVTLGMFLASTLVMKLIDACRERIFSRKSNLHILVANDESYALAA